MKAKTIFPVLLGVVGLGIMLYAFLNNSSPYVDVSEAKNSKGDHLHLAGEILRNSLHHDVQSKSLRFQVKDDRGETIQVVYVGQAPANINSITKVVAIGGYSKTKDCFESNKLLIKCPSKYESESAK
jgi:cytochrome c-type biogenesis protein CcmE